MKTEKLNKKAKKWAERIITPDVNSVLDAARLGFIGGWKAKRKRTTKKR